MLRNNKKNLKNKKIKASNSLAFPNRRYYRLCQPDRIKVILRTISTGTISGAFTTQIKRWNTNDAFAPEVGGGTGATSGYAQWAALYDYYRTMGYEYTITITNNENFAITLYTIDANRDPGTTTAAQVAGSHMSWDKAIAPKGGFDVVQRRSNLISICEVVGSKSPLFDDNFRALVTGSPADLTWLGLGVQSIAGANLTNGVTYTLKLDMYVDFYSPTPLT